ncbi:hypothetical protein Tco_0955605 [Tanacetum coccineum]|uniref:Uncharacterized protein n=1 Tax=Tanacetum coccineum TaxID=301880 RepID=A0ABQ5E7N4_9ASTR
MAASAIAISSDSSDESVGSPPSRVILFGDIPTVIHSTSVVAPETSTIAPIISSVAPMVEMNLVASPIRLCGLVPYSDSDSNSPDEMSSSEHISSLPAISPFLCTDSSEALDSSDGPPSQDPYVAIVARWRSRAHSGSSTRDVPPRLFTPPRKHHDVVRLLVDGLCRSIINFVSNQLQSESPSWNSIREDHLQFTLHSLGPSRKRCRSLVDSVPSSMPVMGSLAPTRADSLTNQLQTEVDMELGNIVKWDDVRDHVEIDPRDVRDDTEEYEANTSAGDMVEVGIDLMSAPIVKEEIIEPAGKDSSDSSGTRDGIVRSFEDMPIDLDDDVRDFYHHVSEVRIDRIVRIETVQRRLEVDQLIAKGQRVSMIERINSLRLENLKVRDMLDIERDHVNSLRSDMSLFN